MTSKDYHETGGANDTAASELGPNDHHSNITAAKAARLAGEKAKKDAADRAAAAFKAKAEKDAQDLEACRAEINTLKAQLQEAQQLAGVSNSLQSNLTAKTNELVAANSQIQTLTSNTSSLSNQVSGLTASNLALSSSLNKRTAELNDARGEIQAATNQASSLNNRVSELTGLVNHYQSKFDECTNMLDGGDVTVRQIIWGGRDLTNDGNVVNKVKDRVRNGWGIPFSNDFFGCDPQPGTRKLGSVRFCRSRGIAAWEYEEKPSVP